VRADLTADAAAFPAALAVVAETGDDTAERLRARIEARAARVVLEAGQRPPHARLQLALKQDVADHPSLARDRLQREDADPGQIGTVEIQVRTAEQLVTAADREQRGSARHRLAYAFRLRGQVLRDQRLLAVLAAADVEQVVLPGVHRLA